MAAKNKELFDYGSKKKKEKIRDAPICCPSVDRCHGFSGIRIQNSRKPPNT
jgi:hypothetical protein